MISNVSELLQNKNLSENQELWSSIKDICNSHKMLFDLFNIQQERIVYLESLLGSSAIIPRGMQ